MKEIIKTNDLATIAYIKLLLTNEGIEYFELDVHMSALEGSISILPRRIMVVDSVFERAREILTDNYIGIK
ncbi:MAG: DUF2007 domain-containing protein [Rhodobacteraceae bacterium]|nr:DUF2007 domain-containing protein [Paracoccaceae bacterium]|tara:strand:- start:539 stop:751 length:213 start_codon:yes stop_codon:yes gene_type:complete